MARHANDAHLHHGRGALPLLAAADPTAELRAAGRRDGDRHGHPRRARACAASRCARRDAVADEIMDAILAEMAAKPGDRVAVLVNSLGATPLMELYILNAACRRAPRRGRPDVHTALVGPYCTSLEMAGASITLMHLDEELTR